MLGDLTLKEFLRELSGDSAAPGGGSAAALSGAMAAALARMVAGLTVGKKAYEDASEIMAEVGQKAAHLVDILTSLVDRDAEAYLAVMEAFKLPRGDEGGKARRSQAIQAAMETAARVPLDTMRAVHEVARLLELAADKGNRNAVTDVAVGALLAAAGAEGAYRNVEINLKSLEDAEVAAEIRREADDSLEGCREAAEGIRRKLFGGGSQLR